MRDSASELGLPCINHNARPGVHHKIIHFIKGTQIMILQCILVFQRFSRHYLLYSEWLACDSSHRRSHELATGPAHTSLFSHGWLPVAPHKLPNILANATSGQLDPTWRPIHNPSLNTARLKDQTTPLRTPLTLSIISLIHGSHLLAYMPRVDVMCSPSPLTLVIPRRAERINEQVNLGKSKLRLHNGLNWKGNTKDQQP